MVDINKLGSLLGYYRAKKVIISCKTVEQLSVAEKYTQLALRKVPKHRYLEFSRKLEELIQQKYLFMGVKK